MAENQETAFKEITRSAPAEKRPHGDDGWGEFVRSLAPAAISGESAIKIVTSPSSNPIMRRPDADLEEKREPRVASLARAKKGDSMKSSDWSLTSAAIEKGTFAGSAATSEMRGHSRS